MILQPLNSFVRKALSLQKGLGKFKSKSKLFGALPSALRKLLNLSEASTGNQRKLRNSDISKPYVLGKTVWGQR